MVTGGRKRGGEMGKDKGSWRSARLKPGSLLEITLWKIGRELVLRGGDTDLKRKVKRRK